MPARIVTNIDKIMTSEGVKNLTLLEAVSRYDSTTATSATVSSSVPPATTGETINVFRHDWLNLLSEYNYIKSHGLYNTYRPVCTLANGIILEFRVIRNYYSSSQRYEYAFQIYKNKNGTRTYVNDITITMTDSSQDLTGLYFTICQSPDLSGWVGSSMLWEGYDVGYQWTKNLVSRLATPATSPVTELLNGSLPPDDPYGLLPQSDTNDGLGNGDYSNDDTGYSGLPTLSSSQVGFCSLYKMTQQQMSDLADYLWGLSQGTLATFLPIFSNPMDCIIAVGIVPVEPETATPDLIKVGNLTTTVYGSRITKQYDEFDMGEIEIGKGDFTNSFMDYSPYTKVELYLPYIGNVSLDTDEVMDSTIGVKYKFDLLSGSCVAEVKVTKTYNYKEADHVHSNILYRYSGNFLANIPINGENFAQMFNAVIGAVAMGINAAGNYKTGIASADMAKSADVSSARSDAASLHRSAAAFNGVGATSAMKPSIQRAGNVSSVCGFLSKQKPEIILKLPKIANIGENQGHEVGYPRYGEYTIAELEGYSSIMMIHLKNIPCTDTERELIERDLNSGVIFSKTAVPQHSEFQNTVKVYKFKCENICVNKADDWEVIDTLTVAWRDPNIDVLNPTIRIEATTNLTKRRILREGNYVYIADFERYYYVKSMKAQAGNFIELELEVDACMSWLTNLRNQKCVVDRQEKVWNTYLNDEFMRVYNTPYTVVKEFPNGFSTQNFVLAVAGGGSTSST